MSKPTTSNTQTDGMNGGRYLYCLVKSDKNEYDTPGELDTAGIEDEPVSLITGDNEFGAVVHTRNSPYDSADLTKLREWLLAHQQVVEAAGERFGTPLPVRFDTVLNGDDNAVITWLNRNADEIGDAFDSLAGRWEYRVTLIWDSSEFEAAQRTTDDTLADIDRKLNQSNPGKQFLLQKQYDQRLRELLQQRQEQLKRQLIDQLAEASSDITERPTHSDAASSLGVELTSDAIAQVALLASQSKETELGEILDELTEIQGVDVRFTGPWPPYTFAPTISDD